MISKAAQIIKIVFSSQPDLSTEEGRSRDRYRRAAWTSAAAIIVRFVSITSNFIVVPLTLKDADKDGTFYCEDACDQDPNKIEPGICGCGVLDAYTDIDGTPNCNDGCDSDPNKIDPGICGCGVADTDTDLDGKPDCNDALWQRTRPIGCKYF